MKRARYIRDISYINLSKGNVKSFARYIRVCYNQVLPLFWIVVKVTLADSMA